MKDVILTITNLKKLIDGLLKHRDIVEGHIDMSWFRTCLSTRGEVESYMDVLNGDKIGDCGTHGCILGWCPVVTDLMPVESDYASDGMLIWGRYSDRIFPALSNEHKEWNLIFGPHLSNDFNNRIDGLELSIATLEKSL